jgi:hypothetical protein
MLIHVKSNSTEAYLNLNSGTLWSAMVLVDAVRSLPENCAMRDGRKWKSVPFIIFANPLECESPVQHPESFATILPPYCNSYPSVALARIQESVDRYYDRLFHDYQSMGIFDSFRQRPCPDWPSSEETRS